MKKIVVLILLLAICCSLFACGNTANIESEPSIPEPSIPEPSYGDQMYEKYKMIIDSIEAEEYEKAIAAISKMIPEPEEIVISVTPENIFDYYEIVYSDPITTRDAQGKVLTIDIRRTFTLNLKEVYTNNYEVVKDQSKVEAGLTCDGVLRRIESIDWMSGEYVLSDETYADYTKEIVKQFPRTSDKVSASFSGRSLLYSNSLGILDSMPVYKQTYTNWWGEIINAEDNKTYYVFDAVSIEIVRAEGTLVLRKK